MDFVDNSASLSNRAFPMQITLRRIDELTEKDLTAIRLLSSAVYPPDVAANWPGRTMEWSPRQFSVIVWNNDQSQAVAHAGIVVRLGLHNERRLKIGGIGGVMTHPAHRKMGHASAAIHRCLEFFHEQGDVDVGLLVCSPELIPIYARLGWREFFGELLVTQKGKRETFTFNRTMTFPIREQENVTGDIDLLGPPW